MIGRARVAVCVCVLALVVHGRSHAADQFNVAQTLAPAKAILAAGGQADIVVIGDSLCFEGLGWSSWLPRFLGHMQNHYGDAGRGYQEFHTSTGAYDLGGSLLSSGPHQDAIPRQALNGIWTLLRHAGSYGSIDAWGSQVELHYRTGIEGGRLEIRDSADVLLDTINSQAATTSAAAWPHTFTDSDSTLKFLTLDPGGVSLLGLNNINDQPGVRVHRGANSGYRTGNFTQRDATFDAQLALLDTDLVIVSLGQNDNYDRATYEQLFPQLIQRLLQSTGNILVLGTYDSGTSNLPLVWDVQEQTAAALGVGFLNLGTAAGDHAFFAANGYIHPDGLHHSEAGADYLAQFIFDAFLTDGASAIPEPASASFLMLGLLWLAARRSVRE